MDDLTGRDAFFQILQWPNGEFRTDPKVVTTCRTISESLTYLLLEAHRLQDEEKYQGLEEPKERLTASNVGKGSQSMSDINTKLKTVPEVEYAVVQTKEGVPVDDASFEVPRMQPTAYTFPCLPTSLAICWELENLSRLLFRAPNIIC